MPAGMKPLEKFLKKQTTALSRAGGFGDKATGTGASRRRASLSRVVGLPFFRETSPESGPAREVFSPDTEEAPCWPSATADIRSPSLSSDEQSSEASLDTNWTPLPPDTPDNLALALLDSVAGKRFGNCTGMLLVAYTNIAASIVHPHHVTKPRRLSSQVHNLSILLGNACYECIICVILGLLFYADALYYLYTRVHSTEFDNWV